MKIELEGELDLVWYGSEVDVKLGNQSLDLPEELEPFVGKEIRLTLEVVEL